MVGTASLPRDVENDRLVLRVLGSSRDGQLLRVRSNKCTIGARNDCTIRLRARGVRPMHCLIVRGGSHTLVRRWDSDTRLNGQGFSSAFLKIGDRLSIGPVELEVVTSGSPSADDSGDSEPPAVDDPAACPTSDPGPRATTEAAPRTDDGLARREAERAVARLREARRQGRGRVRRLVEHLRSVRRELAAHGAHKLEQVREELAAERRALEHKRQELEELLREAEKREASLRRDAEPESRRAPANDSPTDEADEPADAPAQHNPGGSPDSVSDVLRRMGCMPAFDEAEEDPGRGSQPAAAVADDEATRSPGREHACSNSGAAEEDDEGAIDDYLARLLERVRGNAAPKTVPAATPAGSPAAATPEAVAVSRPGVDAESVRPGGAPRVRLAEPPTPRAVAPEKFSDLSAMRQVANLSTRAALSRHARGRLASTLQGKALVAILGFVGGATLLGMWWTHGPSALTLSAGVAALVVGAASVIQYVRLAGRLRTDRAGQPDWDRPPASPPSREPEPQPHSADFPEVAAAVELSEERVHTSDPATAD